MGFEALERIAEVAADDMTENDDDASNNETSGTDSLIEPSVHEPDIVGVVGPYLIMRWLKQDCTIQNLANDYQRTKKRR